MSESTQIQAQIQSESNVKIIEVNKRIYNVIRSIVDSSTKSSYEWNKPIVLENCKVKFVKYKVLPNGLEVKAWEVIIEPMKIQKEGAELNATTINVYDGLGNTIAKLVIRSEFTVAEQDLGGFKHYVLKLEDYEISARSIHEYEYYFVSPSEPVPYARPVSLASFMNKLMFYYHKAMGVIHNADANENEQL